MTRTVTEDLSPLSHTEAPPRAVLLVVYGPDPARIGERLELNRGELTLGRESPDFEGGPLDDRHMSSRHATARLSGATLELRDEGSKNGLVVATGPARSARLSPGDVVQLGRTFLQLRMEPPFDWAAPGSALAGVSHAVHQVREAIRRAARHAQPVLVLGPSGAGKEPSAREIHRLSGRKGDLVAVNCAALPQELAESELFGHAGGAFTGAKAPRRGLLELAHGGTLLLDEVGAMPASIQPKLLRAVQERRVRPVGSNREVEVDVRLVGATNQDLLAQVRDGTFREDLYARLCGGIVQVPPLADRLEDVPTLALRFLRDGDHALTLAPDLVWALLRHPWPLNVRELRQLVLATAPGARDGVLGLTPDVEQLLAAQRQLAEPGERPSRRARRSAPDADELDALLQRNEGVVSRAAAELGVHRYQLYRWLEAAGIDPRAAR